MKTMSAKLCMIAALGGVLSGCLVGPDYHRPAVAVPARYTELPGWTAATPADAAPKGDWWTDFQDPLLNQLEPMVAISNQSVRQNFANYQQALAEVKVARGQLFPTIGIAGSATRSGGPGYTGSGTTTGSGTPRQSSSVINSATFEGTASWAPDLWGKVRRLIEQNAAIAQS